MSFTVGQLAKLTGLTVRALHHYHAIGLLEPSQRSESGYRLYTQADIVRLFRIQALQRLNLSLSEVAAVLAKDGAPLPEMIAQQLDELDDRIEKASALRLRLSQIQDVLTRGDEPVAGDWLAAVELITQYDKYCSSDELQRLLIHSNSDKDQWRSLLAELREAVRRDVPVQSDHAQTLADRWMQLMMARVGGDVGLAIKMKLAYHAQPNLQARMQAQSGLDTEMMDYLTRALRHGNLPPGPYTSTRRRSSAWSSRTTACANGCVSQARCATRWRPAKVWTVSACSRSSPNGRRCSTNSPAATQR